MKNEFFYSVNDRRRRVAGKLDVDNHVEYRIDRTPSGTVGYLFFNGFNPGSMPKLNEAFTRFHAANLSELIIDLRYNPGGNLWVAERLVNLVAGNQHVGKVIYKILHNQKYSDADYAGRFSSTKNGLDLKRLFVLTSTDTCSASEMLMVNLQPYLPVISVGETTCGKPMGSSPLRFGDLNYMILTFRVSDAKGMGMYHQGLVPECAAKDDIGRAFKLGTPEDPMFRIARNYIETGRCE